MYSAIATPLGSEQAKGSPASPRDAWRLLPTWARQRAGDHCGLKIVDPARTGVPASPSQTSPFTQKRARVLESGRLAGWLDSAPGTTHRVGRPSNFSILRRSRLVGRPAPRSRAATTTASSRGGGGGLLSI